MHSYRVVYGVVYGCLRSCLTELFVSGLRSRVTELSYGVVKADFSLTKLFTKSTVNSHTYCGVEKVIPIVGSKK